VRLVHELESWPCASFLTLTFNEIPPDYSVHKKDVQDFMKRLRSRLDYDFGIKEIKYFACGEYGEEKLRPHYHVILFGFDFSHDRVEYKKERGNMLYTSEYLEDIWGYGYCPIGTVTKQSCDYVARYVMKKIKGPDSEMDPSYFRVNPDTGEVFHVEQEFVLMSRKPAIGLKHFDKYWQDWYEIGGCTLKDGKKTSIPRVYDRWLERIDPDLVARVKAERKAKAENNPNNSRERLAKREELLDLKLSRLKRSVK